MSSAARARAVAREKDEGVVRSGLRLVRPLPEDSLRANGRRSSNDAVRKDPLCPGS